MQTAQILFNWFFVVLFFRRSDDSTESRRVGCIRRCFEVFANSIKNQLKLPNKWYVKVSTNLAIFALIIIWVYVALYKKEQNIKGPAVQFAITVILGYFVGYSFKLVKLPPLVGMLITGIILRSVNFVKIENFHTFLVPIIRNVAMAVILIKAGLGLELEALAKLKLLIVKLTILPCLAEAAGAAVVAHFVVGASWLWSFLMGFVLSAISPAVIIPPIMSFRERGYGEDKEIGTLVIAASGLDDILSISGFNLIYGSLFYPEYGNLAFKILVGPIELISGCILGIIWGLICAVLPHRKDDAAQTKKSLLLGLGGVSSVFASELLAMDSVGTLICMVSAFVAAMCWKYQDDAEASGNNDLTVTQIYGKVWVILEPILFTMIGAEIDLMSLGAIETLNSLAIIFGALLVRILVCSLSLLGHSFNIKEILFINLAWIPKATVQAALGPIPYEHVTKSPGHFEEYDIKNARTLLSTAVLSILVTAPLGAICILLTGTCLLTKTTPRPSILPESKRAIL